MTLHYNMKKGKKVLVILKDGTRFVDRWMPHDGRLFCFQNHKPVRGAKIRHIGIYNKRLGQIAGLE